MGLIAFFLTETVSCVLNEWQIDRVVIQPSANLRMTAHSVAVTG